MSNNRISDYEAWPMGGVKPTTNALALLAVIYTTTPEKLVDHYDREKMSQAERVNFHQLAQNTRADHGGVSPTEVMSSATLPLKLNNDVTVFDAPARIGDSPCSFPDRDGPWSLSDAIMAMAHKSRRHAENAQGIIMPESTLEEITADIERLPQERLYTDPMAIFSEAVQLRDRIYRLLDQRQYPRQTTQLYYLASVITAVLAGMTHNFGSVRAATELTRASAAYAEIIDHNQLRLWNKTMLAALAFWGKRPQRALDLTLAAAQWATEPFTQAFLYNKIALYSAHTNRPDEARVALARALDAHESSTGPATLVESMGGMFSYPRARLLQVSTMTHLELGSIEDAENNATEALGIFESGPVELRAFDTESSARIDLGHARLLNDNLEGTQDALRPIFELPLTHRADWVLSRLHDFHSRLRRHDSIRSTTGRELEHNIEEFIDATAANSFPTLNIET